jgi:hypothetical protein
MYVPIATLPAGLTISTSNMKGPSNFTTTHLRSRRNRSWLYAAKKLTPTPFDEKIEWTYYELWHHAGRRARMGTAMMGPDYTQWHGFFEVSKIFYTEFVPEAEQLMPGVATDVMKSDYHKWTEGLSKEQLQQQIDFYKERYKQ